MRVPRLPMVLCLVALPLACSPDGTAPLPPQAFAAVSGGFLYTCAVLGEGSGVCWGDNGVGQVGNGIVSTIEPSPRSVSGPLLFTQIDAGDRQTCGLIPSGAAYCWGLSAEGALGSDTSTRSPVPIPVSGGLTFKQISAGWDYTCGVTTAGAAYCWGANDNGKLGSGTVNAPTPVPVTGGHAFQTITTGQYHTCAIATNGSAYCWGAGRGGELGTGDSVDVPTPALVAGGLHFKTMDAAWGHTCGITTTGAAYCWGGGVDGELGNGSRDFRYVPVAVSGNHIFSAIAVGLHHSCALATSGQLFCWGSNATAQLGGAAGETCANAPTPYPCSSTPILVTGDHLFLSVSAGAFHTCAIARGGGAFCWGGNDSGQIGNGATGGSVATPVEVHEPPIPTPYLALLCSAPPFRLRRPRVLRDDHALRQRASTQRRLAAEIRFLAMLAEIEP